MLEPQFRSTLDGQSICAATAPECTCVLEHEALLGSTKLILLGKEFSVWLGLDFPNSCCVHDFDTCELGQDGVFPDSW